MLNSGSVDFIQFEFGGCNIDSRTYNKIYRIVKNGLHKISMYKDIYVGFIITIFLAEKR